MGTASLTKLTRYACFPGKDHLFRPPYRKGEGSGGERGKDTEKEGAIEGGRGGKRERDCSQVVMVMNSHGILDSAKRLCPLL